MAKANVTLPSGATVNLEGSAEEIAVLLERFSGPPIAATNKDAGKKGRKNKAGAKQKMIRETPTTLIGELIDEQFFKTRRTISDVRKKLEEKGHIYPLVQLSTPLLRLTRNRRLRRIKEKNVWIYVT